VSYAILRTDNPKWIADDGLIQLSIFINDNDVGDLKSQLTGGNVSLDVSFTTGSLSIPIAGCRPLGNQLKCTSGGVRALLMHLGHTPNVYQLTVVQRNLPGSVTGTAAVDGPVSVTLHQGPTDRVDDIDISKCRSGKQGTSVFWLSCRE
jgi:hypothetical protein